jgi:hypothetical protein
MILNDFKYGKIVEEGEKDNMGLLKYLRLEISDILNISKDTDREGSAFMNHYILDSPHKTEKNDRAQLSLSVRVPLYAIIIVSKYGN